MRRNCIQENDGSFELVPFECFTPSTISSISFIRESPNDNFVNKMDKTAFLLFVKINDNNIKSMHYRFRYGNNVRTTLQRGSISKYSGFLNVINVNFGRRNIKLKIGEKTIQMSGCTSREKMSEIIGIVSDLATDALDFLRLIVQNNFEFEEVCSFIFSNCKDDNTETDIINYDIDIDQCVLSPLQAKIFNKIIERIETKI